MPKKVDVLDVFEPAKLSLGRLTSYVKMFLDVLIQDICSEIDTEEGKVYISEFAKRLGTIQKQLPTARQSQDVCQLNLDLAIFVALFKASLASQFADAKCCKFYQFRRVIRNIRWSFNKFLKNPLKAKKRAQKLHLFCENLYKELPFEEHFRRSLAA